MSESSYSLLIRSEVAEDFLRPDGSFHLARMAKCETDENGETKFTVSQQYNKPVPKYLWLREGEIKVATIKEWFKNPEELTANGNSFFD